MVVKAGFWRRAGSGVGPLVLWALLGACAAAQDGTASQQPGGPAPLSNGQPPCPIAAPDRADAGSTSCPDPCAAITEVPRLDWYTEADGAAFRREPIRDVPFASLNRPQHIVLSAGDLNADFAGAGRFLIGHTLDECFQVEALYLGVSQSDNMETVTNSTTNLLGGPGNLFSPFGAFGVTPITGLDYNNLAQIRFTSSMQNIELYLRRKVPMPPNGWTVSVLFGVRYMDLPEELDYFTQSVVPPPNGAINSIHVTTANRMVGPEVGALFELHVDDAWWVNFEMKAALLDNQCEQSTAYHNVDNTGTAHDFSGSRSEQHTAYAGDLALTIVYRWSQHFTSRVGYQAIFAGGIASAADNFQTDINVLSGGAAQLYHGGNTVFHGPQAGFTFAW